LLLFLISKIQLLKRGEETNQLNAHEKRTILQYFLRMHQIRAPDQTINSNEGGKEEEETELNLIERNQIN